MQWTRLSDGWASDLTYIDTDVALRPEEAGHLLASRAHESLVRLKLIG